MVGLPASGKSTYAKRHRLPSVSSDELRALLLDDVSDQSQNRRIFALLRQLVRMRFEMGRPVTALDATSITARERRTWIKLAQLYGVEVEAVLFETPLDVCKQRNLVRDRVVPDDVMDRMGRRLQRPSLEEGFRRVTVVTLAEQESAARAAAPSTTTQPERS